MKTNKQTPEVVERGYAIDITLHDTVVAQVYERQLILVNEDGWLTDGLTGSVSGLAATGAAAAAGGLHASPHPGQDTANTGAGTRGRAAVCSGQRRRYQPGRLDNDDVVRHGDVTGSARAALSHNTHADLRISYNLM